jgi:formylglycine-generating enzyme required for sulfatase activity
MKPGHANCKGCGSLFGGKQASTVGLLIANPFGLFDTAGNVYEWVSSPYQGHYPKDGSSLAGPGKHAVVRGGSWFDDERFSRVSMRVIFKPGFKNFFVGFRVLRNLPAKAGS